MEKELQQLGLEEKEALLYMACLETKLSTPTSLAKKSGLKRATVYLYLEKLEEKGLITFEVHKGRKYIVASDPKRALKGYIEVKKEEVARSEKLISTIVRGLQELPQKEGSYSKVYHYEGREGVRFAIEKILSLKKDMYWLGSMETLLSAVGEEDLYKLFTLKRLKQGTTSHAITDRRILAYPRFAQMTGNARTFRFLEQNFNIPAIIVLVGDAIFLLSKEKGEIRVVVVENELMCQVVYFLFHSLWVELSNS